MITTELFSIPIFKHNIDLDEDYARFLFSNVKWDKKVPFISETKNILSENFSYLNKEVNLFIRYVMNQMGFHGVDYKIFSSWGTRTNKGGMSMFHRHSNSFMSGVIYFSDKTSPIFFENPYPVTYSHKSTIYTSSGRKIPIQRGDIIMFPSTLMHFVTKNEYDVERFSIAFNVVPSGEYGTEDGLIHVNVENL